MSDDVVLDRTELGFRQFWKRYKVAAKESRAVRIVTDAESISDLPWDLRAALALSVREHGPSAVSGIGVGITPEQVKLLAHAATIIAVLAAATITIVLVSRRYKFRIKMGKGGIEIQGEPA